MSLNQKTLNRFSQQDLENAAAKEPRLTYWGIGNHFMDVPKEKNLKEARLKHDRELLLTDLKKFQLACLWLSFQKKTKQSFHKKSSYGFKHMVEEWLGSLQVEDKYISNGIFIAAAIHHGFKIKTFEEDQSPNVCINISRKLVRPFS